MPKPKRRIVFSSKTPKAEPIWSVPIWTPPVSPTGRVVVLDSASIESPAQAKLTSQNEEMLLKQKPWLAYGHSQR